MRTIEPTALVTNDGKVSVQVPSDIPQDEYREAILSVVAQYGETCESTKGIYSARP
jgi:hypothetical protein